MLKGKLVWNTALLEVASDPFDLRSAQLIQLFSSRKIRTHKKFAHTRADPFLFPDQDFLYLFLEVQEAGQKGHIEGFRTRDLKWFEPLGVVLSKPCHLSYPQVFRSSHGIHMIPESAEANEVVLYTFEAFPGGLVRERVLLKGPYVDPTMVRVGDVFWLFVHSGRGLELFFSRDLLEPFELHPAGVITDRPDRARCGGGIVKIGDSLYRPAQDGSAAYGGNLNIMKIEEMSPSSYRETLFRKGIFQGQFDWCSKGGHHFSMVEFAGKTVIAVDGKQPGHWLNRPISAAMKLVP